MRYQNGDIAIDDDFARFGSKSYAIDKINSVDVRSAKVGTGCGAFLLGAIAVACALIGVAGWTAPNGHTFGGIALALAALFGLLAWRSSRAANVMNHTLFLTTSSNEGQATQSTDLQEIQAMRSAIESAMAARR